jgi:uncharacterized protein (DUF1778 family)
LTHSPRNKKLTAVLRARLMPQEKELLTVVAEESGATLSQWSRKVLLEAAGAWKDREQLASFEEPKRGNS